MAHRTLTAALLALLAAGAAPAAAQGTSMDARAVGPGAAPGAGDPSAAGRAPAAGAEGPRFPDQGWSREIRELFYFTPQGSRMIPYDWFMALERPGGGGLFSDTAHLQRFGFIPADAPHRLNPDALPIGFAIDPGAGASLPEIAIARGPVGGGRRDLGLTCAACHTATVTVAGRPVRLDGAPAHLDFDSFYRDLNTAVTETLFDLDRFQRFAARVLGRGGGSLPELTRDLAAYQLRLAGDAAVRHPALASGFGRVDALTQIVNALAVRDQGDPANLRLVDAPTSYPPLWLTPQLEFVQWNPIAASPIGRNGGEVLGVFGEATLSGDGRDWFASSLLIRQLVDLENWVADLKPPRWEEVVGPVDPAHAARGEELFARHCASCHSMPPYRLTRAEDNLFEKRFIAIGRVDYREIGVDPVYVESLTRRLVRTNPATASVAEGKAIVPAVRYFGATVAAVVTHAMTEAGLSEDQQIAASGHRVRPPRSPGGKPEPYEPPSVTDLKAGPLAAAWATGPYLHNGSVPTIYELLSPEAERRRVFWTGGRELDRERLGFVSDDAPGRFRFDTSLPGNRNTGHLYPREGLVPEDRLAIIEYLKTQ